ncbi:TIGR03089 family protein [Micromonospora sp. WMMD1102]|uniref:TIGR03089 family protein n=1 Tax=Micromonospora sp. WMMD1102 TaxID=3016105 RepID=UPI002414D4DB|nr:TIGR03089 family protein [Micromonospora sp. WMMD1102]MDG4789691.1 TIGR03089 family protein [Micromonospora sp. WMMD1102]
MTENIAGLFAAGTAADPTRPLLTWYDDASGDRTELSGATLANWVAKTANLLVDAAGVAPADPVGVLLPPHWQTAAVLLGCWSTGAAVSGARPDGSAPGPVDVLFAAVDRIGESAAWPAGEQYALALAPLAAPARDLPPGWADYVTEVRGHGDHFTPYPAAGPQDPVLVDLAIQRATELGIDAGDRVLVDAARHPDPVDWLLAPLAAGASTVLCGNLDPARLDDRAAAEKVTVRLT